MGCLVGGNKLFASKIQSALGNLFSKWNLESCAHGYILKDNFEVTTNPDFDVTTLKESMMADFVQNYEPHLFGTCFQPKESGGLGCTVPSHQPHGSNKFWAKSTCTCPTAQILIRGLLRKYAFGETVLHPVIGLSHQNNSARLGPYYRTTF